MTEVATNPRFFTFAAWSLALAGVTALLWSGLYASPQLSHHILIVVVAALVSENFALNLPVFNVSLAFPLILCAMLLAGPFAACMVAGVCFTNWKELRSRRPASYLAYNYGQLTLSAFLGSWVYVLMGGLTLADAGFEPLEGQLLLEGAKALLVAALAITVLNMLMTAVAARMLGIRTFRAAMSSMLKYAPTQLALAGVGLLIAQVLVVRVVAVPLFLFPLMIARQAYGRYETLKGVFREAVSSLVTALEARDPYTKGHSERVSNYAEAIAACLGSDDAERETVAYAGLLHDIGKLTLPPSLLTKVEPLSSDEIEQLRTHPAVGDEMVKRIPLLAHLAPHVRAHHERLDGGGYPDGLGDERVSRCARVLAVADAYDAMTSDRPYRSALSSIEAQVELQRVAGTQFDPDSVAALVGLLSSETQFDKLKSTAVTASVEASTA